MKESLIQIRNLNFRYPKSNFSLSVPELTIGKESKVALIGKSGCGKTTLAHLIAGILNPTEGNIIVSGKNLNLLTERERREYRAANVGFIFQEFELLDYLQVKDNLLLPFMINRGIAITNECKDKAHSLAKSIGISDKLNQYPEQLSGGERQRLAIARALVTNPSIVIADEPTGNLDNETAQTVMQEIIKQSTETGSTLIMITHDESLLNLFENTINVGDFSKTF
ncbi:MAG: ABC transporter ATP-binding protein [Verrucomicrobiales bacterium]|jgi:putative ABC transport system ATP-binding protein|nr:ABC transporter ATP-binding protein [Verrucomicrobiales bacterium]